MANLQGKCFPLGAGEDADCGTRASRQGRAVDVVANSPHGGYVNSAYCWPSTAELACCRILMLSCCAGHNFSPPHSGSMDQPDQATWQSNIQVPESVLLHELCQKPALCSWESPQHDAWAPTPQKGPRDTVKVARLSL